jgi:hypothetical protein
MTLSQDPLQINIWSVKKSTVRTADLCVILLNLFASCYLSCSPDTTKRTQQTLESAGTRLPGSQAAEVEQICSRCRRDRAALQQGPSTGAAEHQEDEPGTVGRGSDGGLEEEWMTSARPEEDEQGTAGRGSAGRSPSSSTRRWTASPARRARSSRRTSRSAARARSEEDERPRKTTSRARGRQAGRRTERCAAHQSSRHPPGKRPQPSRVWARPRQPWRRSAVGEERAGGWEGETPSVGGRQLGEEGGKNLI